MAVPDYLDDAAWGTVQRAVLYTLLRNRGIHTDSLRLANHFFGGVLDMTTLHGNIDHVDQHDRKHSLRITHAYYLRPYEVGHGLDVPKRAILRGNYEAHVYGTVQYSIRRRPGSAAGEILPHSVLDHTETVDDHLLFAIPAMVGSALCNLHSPYTAPYTQTACLDVPSYCISHTYKQMPHEEYMVNDRVLATGTNRAEVRSRFYQANKQFRTNSTLRFTIETGRCRQYAGWRSPPRFEVEVPHETPRKTVPLIIFALAYGWGVDEFVAVVRGMLGDVRSPGAAVLLQGLREGVGDCLSRGDALRAIGARLHNCRDMSGSTTLPSYVAHMLHSEILPNVAEGAVAADGEGVRKGYILAQAAVALIRQSPLLEPAERWAPCDKRSYVHKRVDSPGEKLASLSRKYIKQFAKKGLFRLRTNLLKNKPIELVDILNSNTIKLTSSVKNGIWDSRADASDSNQHKSQLMTTGFAADSLHMQSQKIVKYSMKKNINPEPLLTHPTQTGRVGLYLTPETEKCGIVRHKALGATVSLPCDLRALAPVIARTLETHRDQIEWSPIRGRGAVAGQRTLVIDVYGGVLGFAGRPGVLYAIFAALRRRGALPAHLGLEYDRGRAQFYFNAGGGRLLRPLLLCQGLPRLCELVRSGTLGCIPDQTAHLVQEGLLEYLDAGEEYSEMVRTAWAPADVVAGEHTHVEVHGTCALSLSVSRAYCTFNSAPRRILTGAMENRSIATKGVPDDGTTSSYSLWHGQDPLQSEVVDQVLGLRHREPNGVNVNVAILSMGDNQEDAWVIKKEALARGLGVTTEYHVVSVTVGRGNTRCRPDPATIKGMSPIDRYRHLREDGLPIVGAVVEGGGAIVGRVFKGRTSGPGRCVSRFIPWYMSYKVESVSVYPDEADPAFVRVTLVKTNYPVVGDKFHLAHGQKGTCGRIVPSVDLPFVASGVNRGVTPDVVINVCSLIRVTQGLLLEMLSGKARALSPSQISQYETTFLAATTFQERLATTKKVLAAYGFRCDGRDTMICGKTGRPLRCAVFNGVGYLRVLKHMARDKLRSRDRGPTNELTRQTSVGKRHFGGQKVGEMENWNFHCHGMAYMFSNVNYECADKFLAYQCTRCNIPAIGCADTGVYICSGCLGSEHVVRLRVPYITSLAFQEMYAAGWGHTLVASKEEHPSLVDEEHWLQRGVGALTITGTPSRRGKRGGAAAPVAVRTAKQARVAPRE
jgi:DNA-directed RNA polymerase beta subunit